MISRLALLLASLALTAHAELKLPAIIGDNMVLQQKQANPVWGWDSPGTEVTVTFAGQTKTAKAGADGKWTVKLDAVPANAKPATITIKGSRCSSARGGWQSRASGALAQSPSRRVRSVGDSSTVSLSQASKRSEIGPKRGSP